MNKEQMESFQALLSTPKKIALIVHENPDGDAIGAALAMRDYLESKEHIAQIVLPNNISKFLKWLPGIDNVFIYDKETSRSKGVMETSEVIFLLDFNTFGRAGKGIKKYLDKYEGIFAIVDHHHQPDLVSKFVYSDVSISSTCEMIYHFIEMMGDIDLINENIATCLYTGIMTDTGSFRYSSTTSTTHRVVGDLIEKGAKNSDIYNSVYNNNSYSRLQLLGVSISNLKILKKFNTAFMTLSKDELDRCNFQKGDTEDFVNYGLSLAGICFSVIFIEDKERNIIKISFRSKGNFSVNKFSRNHFDGGGHDNSAGGYSKISLEETVEKFIELLPVYKDSLINSHDC